MNLDLKNLAQDLKLTVCPLMSSKQLIIFRKFQKDWS